MKPNMPAPRKFQKFTPSRKRNASDWPKPAPDGPAPLRSAAADTRCGALRNCQASRVSRISGTTCRVENTLPMASVTTGLAFQ